MSEAILVKVKDLKYDEKLYPRTEVNSNKINEYVEILSKLPPITLTFKRLSDIPHNFYCYRLHLLHNY